MTICLCFQPRYSIPQKTAVKIKAPSKMFQILNKKGQVVNKKSIWPTDNFKKTVIIDKFDKINKGLVRMPNNF